MLRVLEDRFRRTLFDDSASVHDGDSIGKIGDDGKVMGDVQRSDTMLPCEDSDCLQHVRLGAYVEPGRRLVEHDHRWTTGERHRQADSLLLTTRQLVRISAHELGRRRQEYFAHHLDHPSATGLGRPAKSVKLHHLEQLRSDSQCRVQRARRILRYVADEPPPGYSQIALVEGQHRRLVDRDFAAADCDALAGMTKYGKSNSRLARARLSNQAEHLARRDREGDLVDDVRSGIGDVDPQR